MKFRELKVSRRFGRRFLVTCIRRVARSSHAPKLVVVTGSVGKTSTHAAIVAALSGTWPLSTVQNDNNSRGPMLHYMGITKTRDVLKLSFWLKIAPRVWFRSWRYPYQIVVMEVSEISLDSQADFFSVVTPNLLVVTSLTDVHAQDHSLATTLAQIQRVAASSDHVLVNADFVELAPVWQEHPKYATYGQKPSVDYRLLKADKTPQGLMEYLIKHRGKSWPDVLRVPTKQLGTHSGLAYTAALAATHILHAKLPAARAKLGELEAVKGRMRPIPGLKNSLVIDDSYNANALSMCAALDTLGGFTGYRIAVLGSMNEMGELSQAQHEQVGKHVPGRADLLITVGKEAKRYLAPAARAAGMKATQVHSFLHAPAAGAFLATRLRPGSTVLGKGSQDKIYVEEALKCIIAPEHHDMLVRQPGVLRGHKARYLKKVQARS